MDFFGVLLTLCCVYQIANSFGFRGFHFRGLEEPRSLNYDVSNKVIEAWITQPLDHFNHRDNRTWSMRYYENAGFFKKDGPIFIMIGGEWEIAPGFVETGLMHEIASKHNGIMYYTEHRYYGKSKPTENTSPQNLQYLNVDQALADLAYFIETKKNLKDLQNSSVIVFGGSYAGNMAAWARLKYPHLIQGALASSAPVFAKADFPEYYDVVRESLGKYSSQCVTDIKTAFDAVEELLATKNGAEKLKSYFNLCDVPDVNSPSDLGYFMNLLAEAFAGTVQTDRVENGRTRIAAYCEKMTASHVGSPLERLARLVSTKDKCLKNSYKEFIKIYRNESWESAAGNIMRQWYHQTCTEYGYYQTTNSSKSIFGTLFPLNFFTKICTDLYGDYYDGELLDTRVRRTNIMYGGFRPDLKNVIFSNGEIDPWHSLSVLEDLNESSPAIFIKGASHCRDIYSDSETDGEDLIKSRARIRDIIDKWISQFYKMD